MFANGDVGVSSAGDSDVEGADAGHLGFKPF